MYRRLQDETGPLDIIGDVHGCTDELETLLGKLGYEILEHHDGLALNNGPVYTHPQKRKAVFVGDLVDRGPRILDALRLVHNMMAAGSGLSVIGNHDDKLLRWLKGHKVMIKHGLETTIEQIYALPGEVQKPFKQALQDFLETLPNHLILDNDRLIIAHAGLKEKYHATTGEKTRAFALYGENTGKKDEYGLPIRGNWEDRYTGGPLVVYGHTPLPSPKWTENTVGVDTGCIFGGKLTALRYPERETVSVVAKAVYYESAKPFPRATQAAH